MTTQLELSQAQKQALEKSHRYERDGRIRDRIKAVLLRSEGWKHKDIAQALRIHEETVMEHISDWQKEQKLKPENGGSCSKLIEVQSQVLAAHLEEKTYTKVIDICTYVEQQLNVRYTVSGMTKWLHQHGFSYKQPKAIPAKADAAKQEAFIESYIALVLDTPQEAPILFLDAAHPTMATQVSHGWIKKGIDKPIAQTASRTRVNIMGAIELNAMKVLSAHPEKVNAESTVKFLEQVKAAYPNAPDIHIILDQSGYHQSKAVQEAALTHNITLHYLPPYSPNLNPIERLWKVMNEEVRNNVFFTSARHFRDALTEFFEIKLAKMSQTLRSRINDNFQIIKPVSSG